MPLTGAPSSEDVALSGQLDPWAKQTRRLFNFRIPLDKTIKQQVILDNARAEGDTGSAEVQIALMQSRITQITEHLKQNKKDNHSLRGLMLLVGKRRRLEAYLKKKDINRYRELIKKLGIREAKPR